MLRVLPHTHKPVLQQIRLLTGLKQGGNAIHWPESYDSCGRQEATCHYSQFTRTVSGLASANIIGAPTELTYQEPHNLRDQNPVAG